MERLLHGSLAYSVANESSLPRCMHAKGGEKGSVLDTEVRRDEGHDGVPSVGKPLDVLCAR